MIEEMIIEGEIMIPGRVKMRIEGEETEDMMMIMMIGEVVIEGEDLKIEGQLRPAVEGPQRESSQQGIEGWRENWDLLLSRTHLILQIEWEESKFTFHVQFVPINFIPVSFCN